MKVKKPKKQTFNAYYVSDYATLVMRIKGKRGWEEKDFINEADRIIQAYIKYPEHFFSDDLQEVED
jgi:hypothetical protein